MRIVYTSFLAAAADWIFTLGRDHHATEEHIKASGVEWTFLRGRDVRFQNETVEEAYASRARYGAPEWQVDAWVSTYTAVASGALSSVSPDVEVLTGTPPQSLEAFLREVDPTP